MHCVSFCSASAYLLTTGTTPYFSEISTVCVCIMLTGNEGRDLGGDFLAFFSVPFHSTPDVYTSYEMD